MEEQKDPLKDMKAKYGGTLADVGKLQNHSEQNEMLEEELMDEGRLVGK